MPCSLFRNNCGSDETIIQKYKCRRLTMDPERSSQDVLRCNLCETSVPPMYCVICHLHLCKACVWEHLSDFSKEHKIVPFEKPGSSTKCSNHLSKICELYCEQCDLPICVQCASSKKHQGHVFVDIMKILEKQKVVLQGDLQELKNLIYPNYQETACLISIEKARLIENSRKIATAINKHGEDLHREINVIINTMKADLDKLDHKHLAVLNKHEDEIKQTISEITKNIADLEKIVNSDDVGHVFAYKSRNTEFKRLPLKLTVTLPNFTPHKINREHIYQQFGSLTSFSNTSEKHGYKMDATGAESSRPNRELMDMPQIITQIKTEYEYACTVSCLSDEDIWVLGNNNVLKLYNLQTGLLKSIQTKSGKKPRDIAVTRTGNLVYTDYNDKTVNIVKNTQIETVIRLQGWIPCGVCSTSSGDLLVTMYCDDNERNSKVVRYSTEKQCIQYEPNGQALYSSRGYLRFITENRNLDICLSDFSANAVVVVNRAGEFRFSYKGNSTTTNTSLHPHGITTDSQSHILIADRNNDRIHILDQDGQFIRYITKYVIHRPYGLCIDTKDNLIVTENATCTMKKVRYYL
nr:uncharacterized protein LOC117683831 [Crassostrea gigas]